MVKSRFKGILIGLLLVGVLLIRYNIKLFIVSGVSMQPTLTDGNFLIANREKDPEYGSLCATIDTTKNVWVVKRLIGKKGDYLKIEDGVLFRNGEKVEEDYVLSDAGEDGFWRCDGFFLMGDNRYDSCDSRYWGCVDNVFEVVEVFK